jgi:Glycosyl hydrolase family 71
MRRAVAALAGMLLGASTVVAPLGAATARAAPAAAEVCPDRPAVQPSKPPVLAHFYIWFTEASWNRAKVDYPAVGRYSSDSVTVMQEQVAKAKAAGIDGFIVSWKDTPTNDRRLEELRGVAARSGFKLAITYQAQDFYRRPLPVDQVRHDLTMLADTYANDPVFQIFGTRPVVAISGTWHYSEQDLRSITAPVASRLRVLATEKSVSGYERVASAVEGELYYWSSADPETTPGYASKLVAMANSARSHCGLWVAPVAPGFDARDIGGHSVVERRGVATLRASWQAALASTPDAIGVISWNEFSENTYIEPSQRYGSQSLDAIADLVNAPPPPAKELDSSASDVQGAATPLRPALSAAAALGLLGTITVWGFRRRRGKRP